ncbi:MAG TPA: YbjN domain-containing protein [Candidatus Nanopelagicales bacterium]|jgi:drug/metabolite transporter superfamily protein YnfA
MDERDRNIERRTGRLVRKIFRSHVENCLKSIWETVKLESDSDGDYPFLVGKAPAWVSVRESGSTPAVRVFAYACVDVRRTLKLLAELNEINAGSALCRVYRANGTIVVEASLPWQLLDERALQYLIDEVAAVATQVAELIALVHGGRVPLEGVVAAAADDEVA